MNERIVNCLTLNSLTLNVGSLNVATSRRLKEKPIGYFKFVDPEVSRIVAENWGDGIGTTLEQIQAVSNLAGKFRGNTIIENFDEFEKFIGLSDVGSFAFADCSNLKSINIPKHINFIQEYAFANCTSLSELTIPNNINRIGRFAFNNCTSLSIDLTDKLLNITELGLSSFNNSKVYGIINMPKITNLGSTSQGSIFKGTNISEINIDGNVESIPYEFCNDCSKLNRLTLGESIKIINAKAFMGCDIKELNLPYITHITDNTFSYNSNLKKAILPSIVEFGSDVFTYDNAIELIDLGANCTKIATYSAFIINGGNYTLISRAITPPVLGGGMRQPKVIYVPDASVEAYKTATNWVTYADRIKPLSDAYITLLANNKYVGRSFNIKLLYGPLYEYEKGVTWSITSGSEYASIDQEGNVTINESANNSVITVRATSIYNDMMYNDIDITVTYSDSSYLYILPEQTVFNNSNYIDTGVQLMDEDIDYTIYVRGVVNAYEPLEAIFHCVRESSPYPGILMDCTSESALRIGYGKGKGFNVTYTYGNEFELKVTHASGIASMSYSFTTNGRTTSGEKTDYEFVKLSQTLLIGAYQTIDGSKGRFLDGTISEFYIRDYVEK